jgi:hypothetical protein
MTAEERHAVEFLERLVLLKTNGRHRLAAFEPIRRRPREHFVDYALRVRSSFLVSYPECALPEKVRLRR